MEDIPALYLPSRSASKQMARRFARDAADGLLSESNYALTEAVSLVRVLRGCGAGSISVGQVRDSLIDAFRDAQGCINRELDKEGLAADGHQLDLSELEAS